MSIQDGFTPEMIIELARELRRLAKIEDDRAAAEAATVPYWSPCPPSVLGARAAARALRADAELLDTCWRPQSLAS
ncbi:hypothetical protein GCM10011584_13090 [Nocardioides phosphati]|uniref:DUF222 domain-containing protein n=1 Tax=Nocardioides phosphati TaxID=1867775 RepID=A0ABQ2N7U1_9ACTN|nr:hypothetical protein [Nocardioides phosphati]GGO87740.1 hypothetical protein GCM10011584_13090 [Nocardioides phosphati]